MNVMLKLRMEGVFYNQDYGGINFHVWLSLVYFAGIEFYDFAERETAKLQKFPPAKICGVKVYSKSEVRVKDYLNWNCWHFQKTKTSQKHRVFKK